MVNLFQQTSREYPQRSAVSLEFACVSLACVFAISCLIVTPLFSQLKEVSSAEGGYKPPARTMKVQTNDQYTPILINNVMNYYSNNGDGSFNPYASDGEGFEFPKGSGKTVMFEDGLVWGCYQNGTFKVGGSTYFHGLQAGRIVTAGNSTVVAIADSVSSPQYRIYRVRPDVTPLTPFAVVQTALQQEALLIQRFDASVTAQSIYNQYVDDWNHWPATQGAPFEDRNGNGVYEPTVDVPGIKGADQTLWHVSNDLDSVRVHYLAGSAPIGLEVQRTIWGYNRSGALGNAIFVKYRLINKSGSRLDSVFVSRWTDPDIGGPDGAPYDLIGCDTLRNLGFAYKGVPADPEYGTSPPAVGVALLQGPVAPGLSSDSARVDFSWRRGYKNLSMSSFYLIINSLSIYPDPTINGPVATKDWYNIMHGLFPRRGVPFTDSVTHQSTKFCLSGDPTTGSGWVDGPVGLDRRMVQTIGPFTMAVADTQEVVLASIAAQAGDRLASVTALKSAVDEVRSKYTGTNPLVGVVNGEPIAKSFSLAQNYPNPFNPSTTIRYELPKAARVTIKIFNTLGQEIAVLVNEHKDAGSYQAIWNANVPSGIYFYRLQAGEFVETKKAILLK